MKYLLLSACLAFMVACAPPDSLESKRLSIGEKTTSMSYLKTLSLDNMEGFQDPGANWSIAGSVASDRNEKQNLSASEGTGVLANQPSEEARANLFTAMDHGDMELDIEFMMPSGSNSGIYFMSRYEVQLLDSWKKEKISFQDCGSIYQRWDPDRGEGKEGYEGATARMNATRAPGVWQRLQVDFRAPKFDDSGKKIANALFKKVVLNGITIHEDVEVSGPTRAAGAKGEVAKAPLMIQGDHGPVAFRNISYLRPEDRGEGEGKLLSELTYRYYEYSRETGEDWQKLPDFSKTNQIKGTGSLENFNIFKIYQRPAFYAIEFTGQLNIPKEGEYTISIASDDGSRVFVDGDTLIDYDGLHGPDEKSGTMDLTQGAHDLTVHYQQAYGSQELRLFIKGPGLPKQSLGEAIYEVNNAPKDTLELEVGNEPYLLRSFVMASGLSEYEPWSKRTHAISVGEGKGPHYSVDMGQGSLLQVWRGDFANTHLMWVNRGQPQIMQPLGATIMFPGRPNAAFLKSRNSSWPDTLKADANFQLEKYELDEQGRPTFLYNIGEGSYSDKIVPTETGISRSVTFQEPTSKLWYRLGTGDSIEQIGENQYAIMGPNMVLNLEEASGMAFYIRETSDGEELVANLRSGKEASLKYSLVF